MTPIGALNGTLSLAAADAKLLGEAPGDFAGLAVGPAGDVNADEREDLMVGAMQNDAGGLNAGAVYLLSGDRRVCGKGHARGEDERGHEGGPSLRPAPLTRPKELIGAMNESARVRIAVFGAGGIGGDFGGRLALAGVDVHLIARGLHLRAPREHGLRVRSIRGDFATLVHATDDPVEVGACDYVPSASSHLTHPTQVPRSLLVAVAAKPGPERARGDRDPEPGELAWIRL